YIGNLFNYAISGNISGRNYMGMYYFADGANLFTYGKFPQASSTNIRIEGTPNAFYNVMKLVNPPVGFTPLASPAVRGVWVYDYINWKTWYEPCENEMDDTYKGANVVPTNPQFVEVHGDRIYISGSKDDDDNVFISDVGNGLYFPVFLPIQLPPNSDKINGMIVFHDSVVVGRSNDIHVIYGNTNRTDLSATLFRLKRINTHTG